MTTARPGLPRLPAPAESARRPARMRLRWVRLFAGCAIGCLGEAAAAHLAGTNGVALAPQALAPQPFAAFHDLRWLLLLPVSTPVFAAVAALLLAARVVTAAWLLRAAWPAEAHPPGWRRALRTAGTFTTAATLLMVLFTGLDYATAVASVSWLTFASVPAVLIFGVLAARGNAEPRWWARPWQLGPALVLGAAFAAWSGIGAVTAVVPAWPGIVVAGVGGGLVDAWAWRALARAAGAAATITSARARRPAAGALAAGFAAVVLTGTTIGFHVTRLHPVLRPAAAPPGTGVPVLVASGFGTPWDGTPPHYLGSGFSEWRFSYAGLDAAGLPRPFLGPQTYAPLPTLVARMAAEVAAIHAHTGRPVDIVAESEGALVATAYLHAASPAALVGRVVLLSPLLQPGRVDPRQNPLAPPLLHALSGITQALGSEQIQADDPVLRSIAAHGPALRTLLGCPLTGIPQLAVLPLADATSTLPATHLALPAVVVAGFHGGLLARGDVDRLAAAFLRGGRGGPDPTAGPRSPLPRWLHSSLQALAAAWQQPAAAGSLTPPAACGADRALRHWLSGQ